MSSVYAQFEKVKPGSVLKTSELQLGDVVRPYENGFASYSTQTVKKITDVQAIMFRPYTHTGDFSYTGGVICYVGIEEYGVDLDHDGHRWVLLERKVLK